MGRGEARGGEGDGDEGHRAGGGGGAEAVGAGPLGQAVAQFIPTDFDGERFAPGAGVEIGGIAAVNHALTRRPDRCRVAAVAGELVHLGDAVAVGVKEMREGGEAGRDGLSGLPEEGDLLVGLVSLHAEERGGVGKGGDLGGRGSLVRGPVFGLGRG